MRIVFFTHYFPPEGNAPASRTYEHCVRWVRAGHDVTVITGAPSVPDGVVYNGYQNKILPQREEVDGIQVIRVWTYVAANAGGLKRIANFVSYMISAVVAFVFCCRRPDVVISTSPQFFCGWAGIISAYLKWTKSIVEIRDIWPESIVTVGAMSKGFLYRVLEVLERWMYRLPNHVVAVGNGYKENILAKAKIDERISVVTNGVDKDLFSPRPPSDSFLKEYDLSGRFICSYVGTIGMAHGLEVTLRAAELLKEMKEDRIAFCLIGDGASRERLQNEVQAKELEHWVRFTGRLPKQQMPEVLASSDCLLIHLKKTDLFQTVIPSKIFEAIAMKRPVIMGVRGESAEIVRSANSGIDIEPENEHELIAALQKLAFDREFRRGLCNDGETVKRFSRDHLAGEFLKIIIAVAEGNRSFAINTTSSN